MIFHSIIPEEIVFEENNLQNKEINKIIKYNGLEIEVISLENGQGKIQRIFSTYPKDFLNSKLQPGSIININN